MMRRPVATFSTTASASRSVRPCSATTSSPTLGRPIRRANTRMEPLASKPVPNTSSRTTAHASRCVRKGKRWATVCLSVCLCLSVRPSVRPSLFLSGSRPSEHGEMSLLLIVVDRVLLGDGCWGRVSDLISTYYTKSVQCMHWSIGASTGTNDGHVCSHCGAYLTRVSILLLCPYVDDTALQRRVRALRRTLSQDVSGSEHRPLGQHRELPRLHRHRRRHRHLGSLVRRLPADLWQFHVWNALQADEP